MYKLMQTRGGECVVRSNDDGSKTSIPFDPANTDYQQYLAWLAEGNTPEPAEEQQ